MTTNKEGTMRPRFEIRPHEGDDPWSWEIVDTQEDRVVALTTFHNATQRMCDELNEKGHVDA